jgi:hypothetical protein
MDFRSACNAQLQRPLWRLQQANYGGCVFAVSAFAVAHIYMQSKLAPPPASCSQKHFTPPLTPSQIVSFAIACVYSGIWRLRWAKDGASAKMWPLLGWFSGLLCVGSVAGCVAWGAASQINTLYYEQFQPSKLSTRAEHYIRSASFHNWSTVFFFFGGIEFLCLIIAKLLLLGRLGSNATRSLRDEVPGMGAVRTSWRGGRALPMLYKVFAAAVALCSAVGLAAYAAAGVYSSQVARLHNLSAAACDPLGGETDASRLVAPALEDAVSHRYTCLAVQSGSEAVALVLVSCAYLLIVTLSVAIFRQA